MNLNIVAVGLIFFSVIIIILGIIKIHTYPGKIAKQRNHPQTDAIEVASLLGLLIFPIWMFALVWAYSGAVIGVLYKKNNSKQDQDAADPDNADVVADQNSGGAA
jgi:hypothetical protein